MQAGYGRIMDDDLTDEWAGVGRSYCPRCMVALSVEGTVGSPYLRCGSCGMVRLSA